jgi:hypothetical protein
MKLVSRLVQGASALASMHCGGSAVWSHARPAATALGCPAGEAPSAIVESKTNTGLYAWSCAQPPACSDGEEVVWQRTGRSRDYGWASTYEIKGTCAVKCSEVEERTRSGTCVHRNTPEEAAKEARLSQRLWRHQHPQAACMNDCVDEIRKCTVECRRGSRALLPQCMSACQGASDACTAKCPQATPDDYPYEPEAPGGVAGRPSRTPPSEGRERSSAEAAERAAERERMLGEQEAAAVARACGASCEDDTGPCSTRCGVSEKTCRNLCLPGPKAVSCAEQCQKRAGECSQSCVDGVASCKKSCEPTK